MSEVLLWATGGLEGTLPSDCPFILAASVLILELNVRLLKEEIN